MGKLVTFFSGVATLLLAINTWIVSGLDSELKHLQSERELNFRLYESVAKAIENDDPKRIRAVRVLVEALASERIRDGFLGALETGEVQLYEIRYEQGEKQQAESIKALADRLLSDAGVSFELKKITPSRPTPWYVSVFVCPIVEVEG